MYNRGMTTCDLVDCFPCIEGPAAAWNMVDQVQEAKGVDVIATVLGFAEQCATASQREKLGIEPLDMSACKVS